MLKIDDAAEPIYFRKLRHRSKRRFYFCLLILDLILISTFIFTKFQTKHASEYVLGKEDEIATEEVTPYPTLPPPSSPTTAPVALPDVLLEQAVQNALIGTQGSYGIVVTNLKNQDYYFLNEHLSYYSASLYKLWIMAETYRQIKDGIIKENEILNSNYKTLNAQFNIAPESEKFKEGKIALSVKDALYKMITISDNYAAFLLNLKVKSTNVKSFLTTNGFNESTIEKDGNPKTTAYDTALFFKKLYDGGLINEEYSNKMLELLRAQRLNDKIPKYLPDNITVAHKTGELDEYTHDAGIVYLENNEYIIVVLSKSDNPSLAKERISNISKSVYDYFANMQSPQTP
jgi:beta-lactamase class A